MMKWNLESWETKHIAEIETLNTLEIYSTNPGMVHLVFNTEKSENITESPRFLENVVSEEEPSRSLASTIFVYYESNISFMDLTFTGIIFQLF